MSERIVRAVGPTPVLRFCVDAGRLVRRQVRGEIVGGAYRLGCDVEVEEDRGLLGSTLYFTVSGERAPELADAVARWLGENQ